MGVCVLFCCCYTYCDNNHAYCPYVLLLALLLLVCFNYCYDDYDDYGGLYIVAPVRGPI